MRGRYAIKHPQALKQAFQLETPPELKPRYNIAPGQDVPIIRFFPSGRRLDLARWGRVPAWAKDAKGDCSTINARAETVDTKPGFRGPFRRHRRAIIVTAANQFMQRLHDRMPVIPPTWLDPDNQDSAKLKQLLLPAAEDPLTEWPVSRKLNNPRHDAPDCAEPLGQAE